MTEQRQSQGEPHPGRFRFSLRALFLVILVAGVIFSHIVTSWRLKEARLDAALAEQRVDTVMVENEELRYRLGNLEIKDPSRLYAVASPFFAQETLKWRWQVYVPGPGYRLRGASRAIPAEGFPEPDDLDFGELPEGEFTIEASVVRDPLDRWGLAVSCLGRDIVKNNACPILMRSAMTIDKTHEEWLFDLLGLEEKYARRESVAQGEPLVLIRTRRFKKISETFSQVNPDPCDGIMLWIEQATPWVGPK